MTSDKKRTRRHDADALDADEFVSETAAAIADGRDMPSIEGIEGLSKRDRKRLKRQLNDALRSQRKAAKQRARAAKAEAAALDREQGRRSADIMRDLKAKAKELAGKAEARREARESAEDVVGAIGYDLMFRNGICEVEPGLFSETIAFEDISYQNCRDEDQITILKIVSDMLNYFGQEMSAQFSVINTPLREDQIGSRTFYDPAAQRSAAAREDAEEMNRILNMKLREGVSNLRRQRLLTVATRACDIDDATRRLARINTDLAGYFEQLRCSFHVLDANARLAVVNDIMRPGKKLNFDFDRDLHPALPYTTKDFVAPMSLNFRPGGETTLYRTDDKWCQVLVMRTLSSPLSDRVISSLVDLPLPMDVSWYLTPINKAQAETDLKVRAALIDKEVIDNQKQAVKQGYDYSILPSEVQAAKTETDDLLATISGQSQNLFYFSGLIWTWADTVDELTEQVRQIVDTARANGVEVDDLPYRQRQAMNSILPLGANHVEVTRYTTTDESCIFVPFANNELDDEGGTWYYQNRQSNNLVLGNRGRLTSPVAFICGKTGSGKGFFAKTEILGTYLSKPNDRFFIFDKAGEYGPLTHHLSGTEVIFGPDSHDHLNPLGRLGVTGMSEEAQIAFKCDAVLAQAGAAAEEARRPLTDEDRSIIQRCVEEVYADAKADGHDPVLKDLYEKLLAQPEPQARSIALRYERYVRGAMSFFNHTDTVDFSSRIIDFNIRDVPSSMTVFALVTLCETVRNQMYRNHEQGIRTWIYIEEMESLFKYPTVLEYFRRLANEGRKYGMFLTGITQSTESMVGNEDVSAIVKNSDFIMLLKQSPEDRRYWAQTLGLSDREVSQIDESTPRGYGLLLFGASRIPIKGEFPTDSKIYELFSTDPNEVVAPRRGAA